jgi:hypothetical protein
LGLGVGVGVGVGLGEPVGVGFGEGLLEVLPAVDVTEPATVDGAAEREVPMTLTEGPEESSAGCGEPAGVAVAQPAVTSEAITRVGIRTRTRVASTARHSLLDQTVVTPSQCGNASTRATRVTHAKRSSERADCMNIS